MGASASPLMNADARSIGTASNRYDLIQARLWNEGHAHYPHEVVGQLGRVGRSEKDRNLRRGGGVSVFDGETVSPTFVPIS